MLCTRSEKQNMLHYALLKRRKNCYWRTLRFSVKSVGRKIQEMRRYTGHECRPVILKDDNARAHRISGACQTINDLECKILLLIWLFHQALHKAIIVQILPYQVSLIFAHLLANFHISINCICIYQVMSLLAIL